MRARATASVRKLVVMTLVLGPILGCAELQSASSSEFAQPRARPVESSGSAMRYVEILEGRPCGDAGGVLMFIRNRHPSKGVKATIRIDTGGDVTVDPKGLTTEYGPTKDEERALRLLAFPATRISVKRRVGHDFGGIPANILVASRRLGPATREMRVMARVALTGEIALPLHDTPPSLALGSVALGAGRRLARSTTIYSGSMHNTNNMCAAHELISFDGQTRADLQNQAI